MGLERDIAVAGVYARSLLELAEESGQTAAVAEELDALVELFDASPALGAAIADPLLDAEVRRELLEKIFRDRFSDLVVDTLQVMNRKGRLTLARALVTAYRSQLDEHEGRIEVRVATAVPLDGRQRQALAAAASHFAGRRAILVERQDASLLGGMVLEVGDRKVDTSIARELERLEARLLDRAASELHAGSDYTIEERG